MAAAIASGSQKWNGNCADLVNADAAINTATAAVTPGRCVHPGDARISDTVVDPVTVAAIPNPVSRVNPPTKVRIKVRCEPASPPEPERAISIKEAKETSSQARNKTTTSLAKTSNKMDSVNAVIKV